MWACLAIILLLVGIFLFWNKLPYQGFASRKIISILESNNISVSSLKVENASNSGITLSNIKLTGNPGLNLERVRIKYKMQELISGRVNDIEAENVEVNLYKKDGHVQIGGLERFLQSNPQNKHQAKTPTDYNSLQETLPDNISIKNLNISGKDGDFALSLPLNFTFSLKPLATLNIDSTGLTVKSKPSGSISRVPFLNL